MAISHFTKRIETTEGLVSFYFNRIYTVNGTRYHVSAVGKNRKAIMFHMRERQGEWLLVNRENCPDWIISSEKSLSDVIIEQESV